MSNELTEYMREVLERHGYIHDGEINAQFLDIDKLKGFKEFKDININVLEMPIYYRCKFMGALEVKNIEDYKEQSVVCSVSEFNITRDEIVFDNILDLYAISLIDDNIYVICCPFNVLKGNEESYVTRETIMEKLNLIWLQTT